MEFVFKLLKCTAFQKKINSVSSEFKLKKGNSHMLRVSSPGLRTLCKKYGFQDFGLTRTHYLIKDSYPRLPVTQGGGGRSRRAQKKTVEGAKYRAL